MNMRPIILVRRVFLLCLLMAPCVFADARWLAELDTPSQDAG